MSIANIDFASIEQFIQKATWKYAKSMPKFPHEYTVREWNDTTEFEAFLHYILHFGESRKVMYWKRVYLDVGDYYYWWMGAPIGQAVVINRALLESASDVTNRV